MAGFRKQTVEQLNVGGVNAAVVVCRLRVSRQRFPGREGLQRGAVVQSYDNGDSRSTRDS